MECTDRQRDMRLSDISPRRAHYKEHLHTTDRRVVKSRQQPIRRLVFMRELGRTAFGFDSGGGWFIMAGFAHLRPESGRAFMNYDRKQIAVKGNGSVVASNHLFLFSLRRRRKFFNRYARQFRFIFKQEGPLVKLPKLRPQWNNILFSKKILDQVTKLWNYKIEILHIHLRQG